MAHRFHQLFPTSELFLLEGARHYVQLDEPQQVAQLLLTIPEADPMATTVPVPVTAAPAEAITPRAWQVLTVTSLEVHYLPGLSHSPPRLLQGEREGCCRLDGRYRFVGRGGVVAVGHHLLAEGVDRQEAGRAWPSWLVRLLAELTEEVEMRRITAGLFITVDGVVESPDQWQEGYFNEEMAQAVGAGMAASDTMLLGRRTYEEFAGYWPHNPEADGADYMNTTPKLVVSTTLDRLGWQPATLIRGNLAEELTKLKQQPGKDIQVIGSPTLVGSLLREGVLDELSLLVHPVMVGRGKRLFQDGDAKVPLRLADSKTFSTGVLSLTYRPAGG